MTAYLYKAINQKGEKKQGLIDAANVEEAKERLREQGFMVSELKLQTADNSGGNFNDSTRVAFTLQLGQLLNAGLPLYECLKTLEEQYRDEKSHRIIASLADKIKSGISLSTAMAAHPKSFDTLYSSMVAAGEAAGALELVLDRLGSYLSRQQEIKKQIMTALLYPAVLGTFAFLIVILLITYVVPSIEGLFEGRELNTFTTIVIQSSHFLTGYWYLYIPLLALIVLGTVWKFRTPQGKLLLERIGLKLPMVKTMMIQAAISRFARTMGTLQEGGLPLIHCLRMAKGVMKNHTLSTVISRAEERIVEGSSLSYQLKHSALIPRLVSRMLAVGEETGKTTAMWNKIADIYESELNKTITRIVALAQPVILLVMGGVVGFILMAILLPLTDVASLGGP